MQEQIESLLNMITELKNELAALQDRVTELENLKTWQEQTDLEDK